MARAAGATAVGFTLLVGFGAALWEKAKLHPEVSMTIVIGIIAMVWIAKSYRAHTIDGASKEILATCVKQTQAHVRTLSIKKRQLLWVGDYGEVTSNSYDTEIGYFLDTIVHAKIRPQLELLGDPDLVGNSREILISVVKGEIDRYDGKRASEATREFPEDPIAFERWCAEKLSGCGWNARPTKATGDQGADVIATRDGWTMIVQCKLYKKAVGNKAVQEVSAARVHYDADFAVVICTSGYTKSAKQLANTNDVLLVDAAEIESIAALLNLEVDSMQRLRRA